MNAIILVLLASSSVLSSPRLSRSYRSFLGAIQPTQLPPIGVQEAVDQASYEARAYTTGYRLQNTGYRNFQESQGTYNNAQDYSQYRPQPQQAPVDYRANTPKEVVPILTYSNDVAYDGSYNYNYETADGISKQESGVMTNLGTDEEAPSVRGSYSYTAPDGTLITVNYIADKDGFRAEGAHLPTPPPIPEAIARSLEYIARVRSTQPAGYEEDGQYNPERPYKTQDTYSS